MQLVVQRVNRAAVTVDGEVVGAVDRGLMVLVGVGHHSSTADATWLAGKTQSLRIFPDDDGLMNRSVAEIGGGILAISQFTLYGDATKGRRPSFRHAAEPTHGEALYDAYCRALDVPVARGVFGAHMTIDMQADGPVTLLLQREG